MAAVNGCNQAPRYIRFHYTLSCTIFLGQDKARANQIQKIIEIQLKQYKSGEGRGPFYFQVDGDSAKEKVSYFGNNLADYICNVQPARIKIGQYRSLKTTQSGLFIGGCILTAIGTFFTSQSGAVSPTMLIGLGTLSFSWIPGYIATGKVPEAVDLYNRSIHSSLSAR